MTSSDRYAFRFVLLGVGALWLGALFGVIGSWQHVIPGIIELVPFVRSRPLHVSLVVGWIFMAAVGGIYYYLPRLAGTPLFAPKLVQLHLVVWVPFHPARWPSRGRSSAATSWGASAVESTGSSLRHLVP